MLTIEPPPASRIAAPKTSVAFWTPATFTSSVSRKELSSLRPGGTSMPALLTRTDGAPPSSARTRSSEARSVTSARTTPSASRTSRRTTVIPAPARTSHQTGPRVPSAPVTTATRPASVSALIAGRHGERRRLGDQLVQVLERERRVGGDRVAQRPADQPVDLVGRQAVARRLQREVLAPEDVARGQHPRGDDLLAHLDD